MRRPEPARDPSADGYMRIAEVCSTLGISRSTVERALRDGRLSARRFGRVVLVERRSLVEMIEQRAVFFEIVEVRIPTIEVDVDKFNAKFDQPTSK